MLIYLPEVASKVKSKTNRERRTANFMNKLRIFALAGVCLFCISAVVGTLIPFNVKASDSNEQPAFFINEHELVAPKNNSVENVQQKVDFEIVTRIEEIPYGVTEVEVDTVPRGTKSVVSAGVPGKANRTYLVKYVDGKVVDEALYTEIPITSPVDEVVNVGVGGTVTAKDGTVYTYSYRRQMEATAYTYLPPYTSMTTATGATLRKGIVAVDPREIPMHTKMFITSDAFEYGLGVAEDTGGAIKGNIVDLAFMSYNECVQFGRRQMQVYFID